MAKANPKKNKRAAKQSTRWSNKRILTTILGLLVALVLLGLGYLKSTQYMDAKKFANAERTQKQITEVISRTLGSALILSKSNDYCFNTEQGPYDNGSLWCSTSSAIFSSSAIDSALVSSVITNTPNVSKFKYENNLHTSVIYWNSNGVPCRVEVRRGQYAKSSANRYSGNPATETSIMIICADRAKAKHYPFTN